MSKLGVGKARAGEETAAVVLQRSSAGARAVFCFLKEAQKNQKKNGECACIQQVSPLRTVAVHDPMRSHGSPEKQTLGKN